MKQMPWDQIRKVYEIWMPEIIKASQMGRRLDPYFIDWLPLLTPIEQDAWNAIRSAGIALYPQIPVLSYFVDFANPYHKIGLELDGKQWHSIERDRERDKKLFDAGWKIFRATGAEAYRVLKSPGEFEEWERELPEYDDAIRDYFMETVDGLIMAMGHVYLGRPCGYDEHYIYKTLDEHRLVEFDI